MIWRVDPEPAIAIAALVVAYAIAAVRMHLDARRVLWFSAAALVLAVALLSPLDAMADDLFAAHMTQHVLLAAIAPPLLVAGLPDRAPRVSRIGMTAAIACALHAVAIWMWHAPALYEAALRSDAVHALEHLSFVVTGVVLWWTILRPRRATRTAYGIGLITLFVTAMQTGVLGALITLSRHLWYPMQAVGASRWGLTPMEDQSLAGLIMWVPGGLVYLLAMSVLFVWWMEPSRGSDGHSEPNVRSLPSPSRGQVIDRDGRSLASLGMTLLLVHAVSCSRATPAAVAGGDATRGKQALAAMGCGACHTIDGVASAHGQVGPPLDGIARRSIIAGELPNTPENMMRWIENPQAVEPTTAMPNLGVTPQSARDMTAYLYTLR